MGNSPFPSKLEDFGYEFKDGRLRDIKTGGPFEFNVSKDAEYNQARYEALGEVLTEEVYRLLESEVGLQRLPLPEEAGAGELASSVFVSPELAEAARLLVLVHGSGVVRAGQWARRLIINNGLDEGTQLPYIRRALAAGYGVIVCNTNDNHRLVDRRKRFIQGSSNPEEHLLTVWDTLVKPSAAREVALVAHSYGGVVTLNLAQQRWSQVSQRVKAVALTDSVHRMGTHVPEDVRRWLSKVGINWVASGDPLDTPQRSVDGDAARRSAGHKQHEWTSWSCIDSVFPFLESKMQASAPKKASASVADAPVTEAADREKKSD